MIYLDANDRFIIKNEDEEEATGSYSLHEKEMKLTYDSSELSMLMLGGGQEQTSYTLVGDGENFVKVWEARCEYFGIIL